MTTTLQAPMMPQTPQDVDYLVNDQNEIFSPYPNPKNSFQSGVQTPSFNNKNVRLYTVKFADREEKVPNDIDQLTKKIEDGDLRIAINR